MDGVAATASSAPNSVRSAASSVRSNSQSSVASVMPPPDQSSRVVELKKDASETFMDAYASAVKNDPKVIDKL